MAFYSAHGRSLGPCSAKNAQLMFPQPIFDGFYDLLQASDDAVCEVVLQSSLADTLQAAADKAAPFAINSSWQLHSNVCPAQQPSCLDFVKLPSIQRNKSRSGRMLSSMLAPFSKLHKLLKGRGACEGNDMSGTENAFTNRPDLTMVDLVDQMEEQWSYSSSSNSNNSSRRSSNSSGSRRSSNSSGSLLNFRSRRTSSSSSSSTYTHRSSGSGSSPCGTPLSSSTHSPRQSLSTLESDSAYEGSIRGKAYNINTMGKVLGQRYQQQQQQDQEGYGQVYRPMYPNRYQDQAATAESRQMQLARAEQELQDWANASREWSRNIAGYGPSQGASRQPGGTLYGFRGISPGYSLF